MEQACRKCDEILGDFANISDAQAGKLTFRRYSDYLASAEAESCPLCSTLVQRWGKYLPKDPEFSIRLENLDGDTPKLQVTGTWEEMSRPTVS